MIKFAVPLVIVCAGAGMARADASAPTSKTPSVSQTIQQLEHTMSDALKAGDTDKLGRIVADDWTGIDNLGSKQTKQGLLNGLKSGKTKVESIEVGPLDVKVLGDVVVVQGSDTEKSTTDGKDSSGTWIWMDVFVKRHGSWVAVRTAAAMKK